MTDSPNAPLQFLDHFVGGSWHYLPPDDETKLRMVHTYSWKIEGVLLYSESTSPAGVSYSLWYWHPSNQRVQALSEGGALDDLSLFEYTDVHMDGQIMVCMLTTHNVEGIKHYREEWLFPDDNHYTWTLIALSDEGERQVMQAAFERRA